MFYENTFEVSVQNSGIFSRSHLPEKPGWMKHNEQFRGVVDVPLLTINILTA